MFERLKKIWQEAKKKAEEVKEFAEDDNRVIKMPPAVFEHEHETTMVDLKGNYPIVISRKTFDELKLHLLDILALLKGEKIDKLKQEIGQETDLVSLLNLGTEVLQELKKKMIEVLGPKWKHKKVE